MAQQKTYCDADGSYKIFSKEAYSQAIVNRRRRTGKTFETTEIEISELVHRSTSTVHGWRCNSAGGPADLETVKELGAYLAGNPDAFLTTIVEGKAMTKLTDRQLDAFKRVHDEIKRFINDYYRADGFSAFVRDAQEHAVRNLSEKADDDEVIDAIVCGEGEGQNKGFERWANMLFILEQEYFDLHGTEVYDDLWHLIQEMNETWMSIQPVHEEVTCEDGTQMDYSNDERMNRYEKELKRIVEKYN